MLTDEEKKSNRVKTVAKYQGSEKYKITLSKYRKTKTGKMKQAKADAEYYQKNKERILKHQRKYQKSESAKLAFTKSKAKRKRNFGYNLINNKFKGSDGHHLNYEDVIYIPKELHRSVSHSVTQNRNMDKINDLAIEWYLKNQKV